MTTQDPDWKALCVAYVKADIRCSANAPVKAGASTRDFIDAHEAWLAAIDAIHAAVKAHGDA